MESLLLPILAVLVGGGIVAQAWATYRGWQIVRGARVRRPYDATGRAGLLPAALGAWHDELRRLGFNRLGETAIDLPGGSASHFTWVLVDEAGTTEVEVVGDDAIQPLASLVTTFGDGAAVQTMHPRGERIRRGDLVCTVEPQSIAAAVERHRAEVASFSARHGRPLIVDSMADHLRHDATYRERHATRFLTGAFLRGTARAWLVLGVAAAGVLWLALGSR